MEQVETGITDLTFKEVVLTLSAHRPIKEMIEDIKSGIGRSFATGKLRELCKLLPEDIEVLVYTLIVYTLYMCIICKNFTLKVFFKVVSNNPVN